MPLGQTFLPSNDDDLRNRQMGSGGSPVQEAIRTLTLRMPRVTGGGAPAPQGLLTAPGMAGMPTGEQNPLMEALMRIIRGGFGGGPGSAPPMGMPGPGAGPVPGGMAAPPAMPGPVKGPKVVYEDGETKMPGPNAGPDPFYGSQRGTEIDVRRDGSYYPGQFGL